MGDVVNLNRFRKRTARDRSAKLADASRARHGRTRSEREQDQQRQSSAEKLLDQHRIDGEDKP